ncbi:MAG: ABC transporter permease subunit/CPBP intramembrane protease [Eubacteriales bacterium]|nr:ABC transporter permease subunit/CPBP intramembrane protease [Eubacteriales bacterium]
MNYKQLGILYKKEILDVIRDKKTILTMVVLPVILYPLLFFVGMQVATMIITTQEEKSYHIAYENVSKEHRELLNDWIAGDSDGLIYEISEKKTADAKKDLENEVVDAYLTTSVTDSQVVYEVHYLSAVTDSSSVSDMLEKEIDALAKYQSEQNVKQLGLDVDKMLYPSKSVLTDCSSSESSIGSILGSIIPFLLITSILMGAMYPAIDATAGEKERGTMETLLTLPIGSMELIMSKFLSVATIALVSVLINIISMGGVAAYMYATVSALSDTTQEFHLSTFIPAILISLVCVMTFALFMSAIVMCICAFAKSFKEANNYITPLTLVVIFTGYIGFIPNVELSTTTALIPVANICLLMKNLLVFKYDFSLILIVLLSNIIYALVSVRVLASIYNSESVLFGESMSGVQLFERRQNIKEGSVPSIAEGLLVLVVALLLMIYIGGMLSVKHPKIGLVIPQLFIGLLPIVASVYIKAYPKKIFKLQLPGIRHVVGGAFLWIGVGSASLLISALLSAIFPGDSQSLNDEYLHILDGIPFWGGLLLIALMPAVCEEIMFRGYLLSACREKMNATKTVLLVSVLFGFSHMSLIKFVPTMLLGIALAYAVLQSESLVVSSLMHFLNNGFAVLLIYYGEKISFFSEEQFDGMTCVIMMVVAIVFSTIGILCLRTSARGKGIQ